MFCVILQIGSTFWSNFREKNEVVQVYNLWVFSTAIFNSQIYFTPFYSVFIADFE